MQLQNVNTVGTQRTGDVQRVVYYDNSAFITFIIIYNSVNMIRTLNGKGLGCFDLILTILCIMYEAIMNDNYENSILAVEFHMFWRKILIHPLTLKG